MYERCYRGLGIEQVAFSVKHVNMNGCQVLAQAVIYYIWASRAKTIASYAASEAFRQKPP